MLLGGPGEDVHSSLHNAGDSEAQCSRLGGKPSCPGLHDVKIQTNAA